MQGIFRHLYGQVAGDRIPGDHRVRVVDPDRRVLDPVGDHGELVEWTVTPAPGLSFGGVTAENPATMSAIWRYSDGCGDLCLKFDCSDGSSFCQDDGIWGAAVYQNSSSEMNGNSGIGLHNGYGWGHANQNTGDGDCANWYANGKDFSKNLIEDLKVRQYLGTKLKNSSISKVELERTADTFIVNIHTARPGIIIGKRGEEIENLKKAVEKIVKGTSQINIKEVKKPDLDAKILAEGVAQQLEKRVMFRRAMKRTVQSALRQSAKGVRIEVSGRLNGAEIARTEWYREGRVPLHTLRADIDYGTAEALTTYGIIGVKVWVFRGEITEDPYKKQGTN